MLPAVYLMESRKGGGALYCTENAFCALHGNSAQSQGSVGTWANSKSRASTVCGQGCSKGPRGECQQGCEELGGQVGVRACGYSSSRPPHCPGDSSMPGSGYGLWSSVSLGIVPGKANLAT